MKSLEEIYSLLFESYNEEQWGNSELDSSESDLGADITYNVNKFALIYKFQSVPILNSSLVWNSEDAVESVLYAIENNLRNLFDKSMQYLYQQFINYLIYDSGVKFRVNVSTDEFKRYLEKSLPTKILFIKTILFSTFNTTDYNKKVYNPLMWGGKNLIHLGSNLHLVKDLDKIMYTNISNSDVEGDQFHNKDDYWSDLILTTNNLILYLTAVADEIGVQVNLLNQISALSQLVLNRDFPDVDELRPFWGIHVDEYYPVSYRGPNGLLYGKQREVNWNDFYTSLDNFILDRYNNGSFVIV